MPSKRNVLTAAAFAIVAGTAGAFAEGDPVAGERLFRQCQACHQVGEDARNRAGPHLNGLIGRHSGSVEGFAYSPALQALDAVWDADLISRYIEDPRGTLPGTRMAYRGMPDELERNDLIAYLATFSNAVAETPTALSPAAAAILEIAGDAGYGEYLSSECTACHSSGGAGIPDITGLPAETFVSALVDYQAGTRTHQVMEMVVSRLGDEEIAALAEYFSTAE